MTLIPYEEFQIKTYVLNRLRESYAKKKTSEYIKLHGELPDEETVLSFYDIPEDLMEIYKRHSYARYYISVINGTPLPDWDESGSTIPSEDDIPEETPAWAEAISGMNVVASYNSRGESLSDVRDLYNNEINKRGPFRIAIVKDGNAYSVITNLNDSDKIREIEINRSYYPGVKTIYGNEIEMSFISDATTLYKIKDGVYVLVLKFKYQYESGCEYVNVPLYITESEEIEEFDELIPGDWESHNLRSVYYWPNGFEIVFDDHRYFFDENKNLLLRKKDTFMDLNRPDYWYKGLYEVLNPHSFLSNFVFYVISTDSTRTDKNITIEKIDIEHEEKTTFYVDLPQNMIWEKDAIVLNEKTIITDDVVGKTLTATVALMTYNQGEYDFSVRFDNYIYGEDNNISEVQDFVIKNV